MKTITDSEIKAEAEQIYDFDETLEKVAFYQGGNFVRSQIEDCQTEQLNLIKECENCLFTHIPNGKLG